MGERDRESLVGVCYMWVTCDLRLSGTEGADNSYEEEEEETRGGGKSHIVPV